MTEEASNSGDAGGEPPKPPQSIAAERFVLSKQLGSGCFGEVWLGDDKKKGGSVAVKLEVKATETKQLANEYEILATLKRPSQQQGFTEVFHFGREGLFICLVMELLGKSLDDLIELCKGKFDVATCALLGDQIVRRMEYLHSKGIIHRDVKPENFMMGVGSKAHIVYLIDFGLSEPYWSDGEHAMAMKDDLTGTARYSSINAHDKAQSRRDDLEATGHMLLFFALGSLPWSGLPPQPGVDEFQQIRDCKRDTKLSDLCKGAPRQLQDYLSYCRSLNYKQRPDYTRLRLSLWEMLDSQNGGSLGKVKEYDLQWLKADKEFRPETLVPLSDWPDIEQPDDGADASFCFCCKRRQDPMTDKALIGAPLVDTIDPDKVGRCTVLDTE